MKNKLLIFKKGLNSEPIIVCELDFKFTQSEIYQILDNSGLNWKIGRFFVKDKEKFIKGSELLNLTKTFKLRILLEELKEVVLIDDVSEFEQNHIRIRFSGIKRLIYGIWHDGKNEQGQSMLDWMNYDAFHLYRKVIEKWSKFEEYKINFYEN